MILNRRGLFELMQKNLVRNLTGEISQRRKTMKLIISSLALALLLSGSAFAADTGTEATTPTSPGGVTTTGPLTTPGNMTGTIQSIDQSGNRIRIQDNSGIIREFRVNGTSTFHNGNDKVSFTDLKAGDSVNFTTTISNGDLTIDSLQVTPR
jgi:hypothetical protein